MKATLRIVTPAAASAVAVLILSACAEKPVNVPGGVFVEEPYQPYQGESLSDTRTTTPSGTETIEEENIYIETDVPVGPVGNEGLQGGDPSVQQGGGQDLQPVDQQSETKANAPEGSVEYKVVKGDTLWNIGMVYGVSVDRLAEINGIDKNSTLRVGQVLLIPPDAKNAVGKPIPQKKTEPAKTSTTSTKASSTTKKDDSATKTSTSTAAKAQPVAKEGESLYVVKKGDNLSMIAQRHHVKLADLIAANKVDPKATLRIGQTLVIPAAGSKAATTSTTTTKAATTTTTKTDSASGTKPAASTTTKTDSASGTKPAASTTTTKAGEGTGGIVEPIGGSSSFGTSSSSGTKSTTSTAVQPASSGAASSFDPVSAVPDTNVISVPIHSESTLEEVANNHDRNIQDLIRLNPEIKPGEKIPAGTAIRMPLF